MFCLDAYFLGRSRPCAFLLIAGLGLCCGSALAQLTVPEPQEQQAATMSAPVKSTDSPSFTDLNDITVHDDALMLLARHIAAGSSWTALRVKGSVTFPGGGSASPASLLIQNENQAVLKVQQSSGIVAIAVEGAFRRTTYADGTSNVDPTPLGSAGLLSLQLLHSPALAERLLAFKKDGTQTVNGATCDKLSLRYTLTRAKVAQGKLPHNVQVDFYFDANTHLIVQSVSSVIVPGLASPKLLTTSYSGYKPFGLLVFPQRITQMIGDMPLWDFAVSDVAAEAKIDSKEFVK